MTATSATPRTGEHRELIEGIRVIDADTHLTEPADLWTSRAPAAYKDRVPRIIMRPGTFNLATGEAVDESGESPMWIIDESVVLSGAGGYGVVNAANEKVRGIDFMNWSINDISPAASFRRASARRDGRNRDMGTDHVPQSGRVRRTSIRFGQGSQTA